ncbi:MAG TPA: LexA family transcriptional regulator [Bacteroidales bacterium]|nr:LexA family transcriptional regulator [Bacteroidales bacterium]
MFDIERIRKLVKWYIFQNYGKNDAEIAERLGYEKSYFSQIVNGKVPVSKSFVNKLCALDQNINKVWISGVGSMLKNEYFFSENVSEMPHSFVKKGLLKKVGIPLFSKEEVLLFPSISPDDFQKIEKFYYIPEMEDQGAGFVFQVTGNYMEPTLQSGDIIVCKHVTKQDPLCWGKIYLIAISTSIQICRLYPDHVNEKQFKIVLDNKEIYPPFYWPKDQVKSIFSVIAQLKML